MLHIHTCKHASRTHMHRIENKVLNYIHSPVHFLIDIKSSVILDWGQAG